MASIRKQIKRKYRGLSAIVFVTTRQTPMQIIARKLKAAKAGISKEFLGSLQRGIQNMTHVLHSDKLFAVEVDPGEDNHTVYSTMFTNPDGSNSFIPHGSTPPTEGVAGFSQWEIREGLNYHPEHPGYWVPFNGMRVKDYHDIRLHNGEIHRYCKPNGIAWSCPGSLSIEDSQVAKIRLCVDGEVERSEYGVGASRLKRLHEYHGKSYPEVIALPDGTVEFRPKKLRWFEEKVMSENYEWVNTLYPGEHTLEEMEAIQLFAVQAEQNLVDRITGKVVGTEAEGRAVADIVVKNINRRRAQDGS